MTPSQIAPGVWRCGTRFVNWYLVDAGRDGVTVIDAGLPGYRKHLAGAVATAGRRLPDVAAVVLTHGHIDHVGGAGGLAEADADVYLHPDDVALADNPRRNRTESSVVPYLRFPATAAFVGHCIAQGAMRPPPMPASQPLVDGEVLAVPGAPLITHTPGHTEGSCVLTFRDHGVMFVGDLLCTVEPRLGTAAPPQLQTRGSNRDSGQAMTSLDRLAALGEDATIVLPGHGGPWRDGIEAAVASARGIGCR